MRPLLPPYEDHSMWQVNPEQKTVFNHGQGKAAGWIKRKAMDPSQRHVFNFGKWDDSQTTCLARTPRRLKFIMSLQDLSPRRHSMGIMELCSCTGRRRVVKPSLCWERLSLLASSPALCETSSLRRRTMQSTITRYGSVILRFIMRASMTSWFRVTEIYE